MTKTFDDIVSNYKSPSPEWQVSINGKDYSNSLELLEFTQSINNSLKFTVKISGIDKTDNIPEDSEIVISYGGGELVRGVLKQLNPDVYNTYVFKGTGYSAELEADSDELVSTNPVKDSDVQTIIDSLINGVNLPNGRTLSTSYDGGTSGISVDDFRVKSKQLEDVNRLMGSYDVEWYLTIDGNNNPVFNVTDQLFFSDDANNAAGNPKDVLTISGPDQSAEKVNQNINRNKGDFDGVIVRGYGDGDDQITAAAGNIGKDSRALIYTDKTILSQSNAEQKAQNLADTNTVSWQEIEVKPSTPNQIYGIGDELRVKAENARLDDNYRVVEAYYKIYPAEDEFESRLNLSNKPQTFVDDFKRQEEQTKSETDYMQGARNVWSDKENSNATNAKPFTLDFEVPQDVVDTTGKNRLDRIELNYSSAPFKGGAEGETIQATNFDPSTEVVSTDIQSQGIQIEESNISQHNHPVGSATAQAGSERQKSNSISFNVSVPELSWESIGTLNAPNPENDLAHSLQFEITQLSDAGSPTDRDLFVAYVAKDFVANFTVNPPTPIAGETATLTENSTRDFTANFDWVFGDGGSIDGSTQQDNGETVEHTFNSETIASVDLVNNEIVISNDYTSILSSGDEVQVDETGKTYTIDTITYDSGSDETTITVLSIDTDETGNTLVFAGTVVVTMEMYDGTTLIDAVTKDIQVAAPLSSSEIHEQNSGEYKDVELPSQNVRTNSGLGSQKFEVSDTSTEDISTQATSISPGGPDAGDTFTLPYTNNNSSSVTIGFDGNIDSDESGSLDLSILAEPRFWDGAFYYGAFNVESQDFIQPNFEPYNYSHTINDSDYTSIFGPGTFDYLLEYYDSQTTYDTRRVGPFYVCYEDATINEPVQGRTINDTAILLDFEYFAGEALSDFNIILDGNQITSDARTKLINDNSIVQTGSSINLNDGESATWDYGVGQAGVNFLGVAGVVNGEPQANFELDGNPLSLERLDKIDLGGDRQAFVSKITFDENVQECDDPGIPECDGDTFDVESLFLSLYEERKALITGLSSGSHTLEIEAEYNDDNPNTNNTSTVTETVDFTVDANDAPSSDFSISPADPSIGDSILFVDESTDSEGDGTIIAWEWNFADGTTEFFKDAAVTLEIGNDLYQLQEGEKAFEDISGNPAGAKLDEILLNSHDINFNGIVRVSSGAEEPYSTEGTETTLGVTFVESDGNTATVTIDGTSEDVNEGDLVDNGRFKIDEIVSTGSSGEGYVDFLATDTITLAFGDETGDPDIRYVEDNPQPNGVNPNTTHVYNSENIYQASLQVWDDNGLSDISYKTIGFGVDGRTVKMTSDKNVGASPDTVSSSSSLETQQVSGRTVKMDTFPQAGSQTAPTDDFQYRDQTYLPYQDMAENYEIYVATATVNKIDTLTGEVLIKQTNHMHDVPRRDDFNNTDADVGAGAENKEIRYSRAVNDEGDVLLDFSRYDEAITLDTTVSGNDVEIKIANEDASGNLTNEETIVANNGTATTSNTYQDDELYIEIVSANNDDDFEVRNQTGDVAYSLAAAAEKRFKSTSENQKKDEVSKGDGSEQDVAINVETGLLEGEEANNYRVFIDDDPDNATSSEREITGLLYNGSTDSGMAKDKELQINQRYSVTNVSTGSNEFRVSGDISSYVKSGDNVRIMQSTGNDGDYTVSTASYDSGSDETVIQVNENVDDGTADGKLELRLVNDAGWYRLKLQPDQPTYTKARIYLDHHKDTQ